ncbi:MAG: hypothetical protein F9K48_08440 [Candidatus Brocadia sp.]|nr:MAG: hypothetical protein F9K48_08440 [Candidatus Brocadia sp.]
MKAGLVYHEKKYITEHTFREVKIWRVPESEDKPHGYKYSLVYIVDRERVIGYDNAEGKGDHRHYMGKEYPYKFQGLDKLWKDFMNDIKQFEEESHEGEKHKNSN